MDTNSNSSNSTNGCVQRSRSFSTKRVEDSDDDTCHKSVHLDIKVSRLSRSDASHSNMSGEEGDGEEYGLSSPDDFSPYSTISGDNHKSLTTNLNNAINVTKKIKSSCDRHWKRRYSFQAPSSRRYSIDSSNHQRPRSKTVLNLNLEQDLDRDLLSDSNGVRSRKKNKLSLAIGRDDDRSGNSSEVGTASLFD